MKKSVARVSTGMVVIACITAIAVALYFGPHWTVHQMRRALEAKDTQALSRYVDYSAVRESFKTQWTQAIAGIAASPEMKDNPFAALGKTLLEGMAGKVIDAVVTPEGVMAMLALGQPSPEPVDKPQEPAGGSTSAGAPDGKGAQEDKAPRFMIEYVDYSTVRIRAKDGSPGAFILRRDGVFGWKLAAVELPPLK